MYAQKYTDGYDYYKPQKVDGYLYFKWYYVPSVNKKFVWSYIV